MNAPADSQRTPGTPQTLDPRLLERLTFEVLSGLRRGQTFDIAARRVGLLHIPAAVVEDLRSFAEQHNQSNR